MAFEARTVTKEDTLSIPVKAGGGCAVKILREKPTSLESIVLDLSLIHIFRSNVPGSLKSCWKMPAP